MAVSKSKMAANHKYDKKTYVRPSIRFKHSEMEEIKKYCGDSLNGFVVQAVMEKIERLKEAEK